MLDLKEMEEKAKQEIEETSKKVISSFIEVIEEEIYKQLKIDVAKNGTISENEYELTLPFNPRSEKGFENKRSSEHGMTNAELIVKVKDGLEAKGYVCSLEDNGFGEFSNLKTKLITEEK